MPTKEIVSYWLQVLYCYVDIYFASFRRGGPGPLAPPLDPPLLTSTSFKPPVLIGCHEVKLRGIRQLFFLNFALRSFGVTPRFCSAAATAVLSYTTFGSAAAAAVLKLHQGRAELHQGLNLKKKPDKVSNKVVG